MPIYNTLPIEAMQSTIQANTTAKSENGGKEKKFPIINQNNPI